jgi:hypothetical protein
MKDKLRIRIALQEGFEDSTLSSALNKLTINLEEIDIKKKKDVLATLEKGVMKNVDTLYSIAKNNPSFTGADIWTFFRDNLPEYIEMSTQKDSTQNILVILTDGYLNFYREYQDSRPKIENRTAYMNVPFFANDSKWKVKWAKGDYGLIPIEHSFPNLRILLLEVNPINAHNPNEYSVIEKYWSQWFNEMKVSKEDYLIKKTDVPSQTIRVIKDFLGVK